MSSELSKWIEKRVLSRPYKKKSLSRYKQILNSLKIVKPKEIILIGGTNGKGSLSELITKLAVKSNISIGTFTSPHILNFNERIRVNNNEISDKKFLESLKKILSMDEDKSLNFYQIISLAALNYFNSLNLDLWVLEIGMGGRLDPMNFLESDISVITKVALDHQEHLGNSIEEIAEEKAGIIKKQKPIIYGSIKIPNAIKNKSNKLKSKLISPEIDKLSKRDFNEIKSLSKKNIISSEVIYCFYKLCDLSKFDLKKNLNLKFLNDFNLFGRLTHFDNILIDSAHNEDAILFLQNYIDKNFKNVKNLNIYFCCSKDKDPFTLLKPFEGKVDRIYLPENLHDRLMSSKEIVTKTAKINLDFVSIASLKEVYDSILKSKKDSLNLVMGSFYFSAEFLKYIQNKRNLSISLSNLERAIS